MSDTKTQREILIETLNLLDVVWTTWKVGPPELKRISIANEYGDELIVFDFDDTDTLVEVW